MGKRQPLKKSKLLEQPCTMSKLLQKNDDEDGNALEDEKQVDEDALLGALTS